MYVCKENINSRVTICAFSSVHRQHASKISALRRFELIWKDGYKCVHQYSNYYCYYYYYYRIWYVVSSVPPCVKLVLSRENWMGGLLNAALCKTDGIVEPTTTVGNS